MIHQPSMWYRMSNWIGVLVGVLAMLSGSLLCAGDVGARVGLNLHALQDASTQRPFLNLFKQARPWITQCWGDPDCGYTWDTHESGRLDLDANGWVRSLPEPSASGFSVVGTLIDVPERFPVGRYLLLYEGEGRLGYRLGARHLAGESSPGRDLIEVQAGHGPIHIQILETDPEQTGNYLRDLRLIREEDAELAETQVFNPGLLARLQPFDVLRFADWMRIEASPVDRWDQRPRPDDATYTGAGGVPLEHVLDLASQLGIAPWLNIPHGADDDYVDRFAALVLDRLDPELPLYLEYSSAVWGSSTDRYQWLAARAQDAWSSAPDSAFAKAMNWYGKRSAEVCERWKERFGAAADRITCVLASQTENAGTGSIALDCPLWTQGAPCREHGIDALAIAPFFGAYLGHPAHASELRSWANASDQGFDALFQELAFGGMLDPAASQVPADGALAQSFGWIGGQAALAAAKDLRLIGYSGGQHLVGFWGVEWDAGITELFTSGNRDSRMGGLYRDFLAGWEALGGELFMHCSDAAPANRGGSWGALEDIQDTSAPKYDALLAHLAGPTKPVPSLFSLGTNVSAATDWTSATPFMDLFKLSRAWITQCAYWVDQPDPGCSGQWDTGEASLLDLDEQGWVRSLPEPEDSPVYTRATAYWSLYSEFPAGRYWVFYEGTGSIDYGLSARRDDEASVPGIDVIDIQPTSGAGMTLTITKTDPEGNGDYLRNIRILPEAVAAVLYSGQAAPLFNPDFVDRIRPFTVLRFMDWARANETSLMTWADRPRLEQASWTSSQGVPLEVMLALSSAADADPWLTIPHTADDDLVLRMALMTLADLDPGRGIYVELSNEVWNAVMPQHDDALALARAIWPDALADDFTLRLNWYGMRSAQVCSIWKQVFGNQSKRVRCVLGAQSANTYTARQALDCPLWSEAPCSEHGIDAIAIAPYFGAHLGAVSARDEVIEWTEQADGGLGALFSELTEGGVLSNSPGVGAVAAVTAQVAAYRALSNERGLSLIAYEGGQHVADIFGVDAAIEALFTEANRDARMGQLYDDYFATWRQEGGALFVNYTAIERPGRFGAWGVLEHVGQETSPKYDALMRAIGAANP